MSQRLNHTCQVPSADDELWRIPYFVKHMVYVTKSISPIVIAHYSSHNFPKPILAADY